MTFPESSSSATAYVLMPLPLNGGFDYRVPSSLTLKVGDIVRVPFGKNQGIGVVWERPPGAPLPATVSALKEVESCLGALPLSVVQLVDWVAKYTLAMVGSVLKMALYTPVLGKEISPTPLLTPLTPLPTFAGATLNPEQQAAFDQILPFLQPPRSGVTLLDGVTGSGKTEVYFAAMAEVLKQDKQVLVLLPEIALTSQWLDRFHAYFGFSPLEWHSDVTPRRKKQNWRDVWGGTGRVVVGARSALFLPYQHLGLIVVDEEHEAAYKQEEGVLYHARDMAVVRAHLQQIPIILASATPSLETLYNVAQGRYQSVHLRGRHGMADLPAVFLIDQRQKTLKAGLPRGRGPENACEHSLEATIPPSLKPPFQKKAPIRWVSEAFHEHLKKTLASGNQALLFLNRRGFAPVTLCRQCGERVQCRYCTVALVDHGSRLLCHHCGYRVKTPDQCPSCQAVGSLIPYGPGVQSLAQEIQQAYPEARCAVMSSDTLTSPKAIHALVQKMQNREIDILVGTQMIAKGYHFPHLTLVGVVDGDSGLGGADPRAAERTFQLLHQVAGRAGRAHDPGQVYIQTYLPDHPVMQALASGDRDSFITCETAERQQSHMPPYGRLAAMIVSGKDGYKVEQTVHALAKAAPQWAGVTLWGPAPAPLTMIRGRHRWRLLCQAIDAPPGTLQNFIANSVASIKIPSSVKVQIDIDPCQFL